MPPKNPPGPVTSNMPITQKDFPLCCRERYWSEIDQEERVERLRKEVKSLMRQLKVAQAAVHKLARLAEGHIHATLTGKSCMPADASPGGQDERGDGPDKSPGNDCYI